MPVNLIEMFIFDEIKIMPFFSIIVPVFNVEQYLKECLDSILNQSYKDFELILVNDGSMDKSLEICEKYAELDSRVILINQPNEGVSAARNKGIELAKGKYIWFVDSDDFIKEEVLIKIYRKLTKDFNVDILGINNYHLYPDGTMRKNFINGDVSKTIKEDFFNYHIIEATPWINVFRREFLLKNNIRFNTELEIFEDNFFTNECIYKAKTISYLSDHLYVYRYLETSLSSKSKIDQIRNKNLQKLNEQIYCFVNNCREMQYFWVNQHYNNTLNLLKNKIKIKNKVLILPMDSFKLKIIKNLLNISPRFLYYILKYK